MLVFAILMFSVALLFAVVSIMIYKGKTQLIHDYHQKNVADNAAYGKAFGKAMGIIAGSMALSGAVALLGNTKSVVYSAIAVLFLGLIVGLTAIVRVQNKYNGGVF